MKTSGYLAILLLVSGFFYGTASAQVTFERIVNSAKEPQNWLTYSGDYAGHRFSGLDQVNASNVSSMVPKWVYQTAATG
jgi:glucose dehydrogenase